MNKQFYEFWGNFFINLARGEKHLEDMSSLITQNFTGGDDLAKLFQRCYGLQAPKPRGTVDPQAWQQAIDDFQRSLDKFIRQWGWVSEAEHQQMITKCETLEKKIEQQQATIKQLRDLLNEKGLGHTQLFQQFNHALEEQSVQFQKLMESIGSTVVKKKN